jgi:HAD superfamily phosphatase (TIGR01668 family)
MTKKGIHKMNILYPKEYIESVYEIDFFKYYEQGFKGLIFDIDNTLVCHGADATEECIKLFKQLKDIGFNCILLSNNKKQRVKRLADQVGVPYIYSAGKPFVKNYNKALSIINCDKNKAIFFGDQIFTDVLGANRAGIYSVLTKPINKKEEIQIIIKRIPEKIVLYFYNLKNKMKK